MMPTRLFEMIVSSTGELSTGTVMLRIALVATSMFAMVHLLSLWATRYGDHHTTAKSFFLSLLLHGCFGLGWATVAETYPRHPAGTEPEVDHTPITFRGTDDIAPVEGKNKLPVWQSGPSATGSMLPGDARNVTRVERDNITPEIISPEVDKAPEMKVAPDVPDFVAQREEQPPDLEASNASAPQAAASTPVMVEQPSLEARPEVTPPTAARANVSRPVVAMEATPRPAFKRGAATRSTTMIEDGAVMTLPSEIALDALPKPQGFPSKDVIRRPGSPDPTPIIDTDAGSGSDGNSNVAGTSTPRRTDRMTRPNHRTVDGPDDRPARLPLVSNATPIGRATDDRLMGTRATPEPLDESPPPGFIRPNSPSMPRAPARAPETYQARTVGQRMANVLKHGGSEASERAVENSLKWMVSTQETDGRWSSSRHGGGSVDKDPQGQPRLDGGKFADSGVTGLVVLSFLGAGYTHERGPYTTEVRAALDWLISQQKPNGYLGADATKYDQMYCHAIATFALAEAYAMQRDANEYPELRNAVKRGVKMISAMQNDDGGWRYGKGTESDMSMFGWQLMALKSAVNAGIPVPEETRRGMVKFLDAMGRGNHGGLSGYRKNDQPTPAMTAEALFCRQMFSVRTNDAASQEAVAYLRQHLPRVTVYDEYFWYYGTLAMHHLDDESWQEWNVALRDMLIAMQRQDGPMAGSWDPKGKWAGIGGRLYSTALSTMCLEVYYRYQSNAKPADAQ
jgi:hypothetical protein